MPRPCWPDVTIKGLDRGSWGHGAGAATLGLAAAMMSGTVDAWAVERINAAGREPEMQSLLGRFQAAMAAGLTLGAVAGGYLPTFAPDIFDFAPTVWNVVAMASVSLLHLALSPFLFFEGEAVQDLEETEVSGNRMTAAVSFAVKSGDLRELLLLGAFIGLVLAMIEGYWQPRLADISATLIYDNLGWITAGYFGMAIIGPMLIGVIGNATGLTPRGQLLILPPLMGVALWLLADQTSMGGFVVFYLGGMLLLAMAGPAEEVLLNAATPDKFRSSIQSLSSLTMRLGGAVSAFGLALFVREFGIAAGWKITAAIFGFNAAGRIIMAVVRR